MMRYKLPCAISLWLLISCFSSALSAEMVWIDVRSHAEHRIDSIEGDVRIAHSDIVNGVSEMIADKSAEIRLYCRSGGRAGKAMSALLEAGYTNVSNEGGINDARIKRDLSD